MQLNSADPALTNPAQIAQGDADCISLTNSAGQPVTDPSTKLSLGSFCSYELGNPLGLSNTSTVNLYGTIGSLDPTRIADLSGGGFLDVASAPEPGQWPVIATGLVLMAAVCWRRQGRANHFKASRFQQR